VLAPILGVEQAGENHSAQLQLPSAQLPGVLAGGPLIKPMSPAVGQARSQDLLIPTDQMFHSDACGTPGGTAKALALIDLDRPTGFSHGPLHILRSRQPAFHIPIAGIEDGAAR